MIPQACAAPAVLTDPQLDAVFARDGYVRVPLVDAAAVRALAAVQARWRRDAGPGFSSTLLERDPVQRAQVHAAIAALLDAPLAARLAGRRAALCTFVAKAPGQPDGAVPLHQDWSFFDETLGTPVGVWCPLVDVDVENGCLEVVPGSHRVSAAPRPVRAPFAFAAREPELRRRLRTLPMRAGEALIFDPRLFHASPPNRSAAPRAAATAVMVPAAAGLRYYHVPDPERAPWVVDVFAVDDELYLHHRPGRPPSGARLADILDLRAFPADFSVLPG